METVLSLLDNHKVKATRNGKFLSVNRVLMLVDSDRAMLEDEKGYRYVRRISLETLQEMIFEQI